MREHLKETKRMLTIDKQRGGLLDITTRSKAFWTSRNSHNLFNVLFLSLRTCFFLSVRTVRSVAAFLDAVGPSTEFKSSLDDWLVDTWWVSNENTGFISFGVKDLPGSDWLWHEFPSSFLLFGNSLHTAPKGVCQLLHLGLTLGSEQ